MQVDGEIGFVLYEDDPFTCIDLDVKDDTTSEQLARFEKIISAFDSYTERSRSGKGYHIWIVGAKAIDSRCRRDRVEVYDRKRFIICTGNVVNDKSITPRQESLDGLVYEIGCGPSAEPLPDGPEVESDEIVLQRARSAENGGKFCALFDGDWKAYGYVSQSEADMALMLMLAFYTLNNAQLKRLFLRSTLAQRDKVAKNRSYLDRTILRARIFQASGPTAEHGRQQAEALGANSKYWKADQAGTDDAGEMEWGDPQPLMAKSCSEPYPLGALPEVVRAAVAEVQGFMKAPMPLVASSALSALSLAIQAYTDVKRAERLTGPVGVFMLIVAESGERKSTCDSFFAQTISGYEAAQAEFAKPAVKRYRADLAAWDAKRAGIVDKIRKSQLFAPEVEKLESRLRDLEENAPKPPRIPHLMYTDATPEALGYGLASNWPSAGVVSAEAGAVFGSHGMGKDSIMRNLALFNVLWGGGQHRVDRRTAESFVVRGARLTMALQVQEATLREFFERSGDLARGTGFLARFLVAWPDTTQGARPFSDPPASWPALEVFNRRLTELLGQPVQVDEDGALILPTLSLSPEAKVAWVAYHDFVEQELATGGAFSDVRDVASKSADNAVRLAALFHVFEHGVSGTIDVRCVEAAAQIARWHLNESRRFFGELMLPASIRDAMRLDRFLVGYCQREGLGSVEKNFVRQYGPHRDRGKLDSAVAELCLLGRVRLAHSGRRKIIEVNPALLNGEGV
ncbi:hypothetical protein WS63_05150 [Burkholderia stagnalis]|nr:hypothetical protein WS63_05150 [Burkholderia stagnalis]